MLLCASSYSFPRADASSFSLACSFWYGAVAKIFLNIFWRSSVVASSIFLKSPWAIIATPENWPWSRPRTCSTASLTSLFFVTVLPSGYLNSASAFSTFTPSPLSFGLSYSGFLFTVYSFPAYSKVRLTSVGVPGSAYFERIMLPSLTPPLAESNRA